MALNLKPKAARQLPGAFGVAGVGVGIGAVSALVAIGGGSLTVPFLTWCNVRVQQAIALRRRWGFQSRSAVRSVTSSTGWGHPGLPEWSLGFVYLPAFALLVPASMLTAPLGARLAHRLPVATLKRIFSGVLIFLAGKMLWSIFG